MSTVTWKGKRHPEHTWLIVFENGQIFSEQTNKFLVPIRIAGYFCVYVAPKKVKVHRLVLETYVGPCPKSYVGGHLDGNPLNNAVTNLKWITQKENAAHRVIHNTHARGEKHGWSKLTDEAVIEIRKRFESYIDPVTKRRKSNAQELAQLFRVRKETIQKIAYNHRWTHLIDRESVKETK